MPMAQDCIYLLFVCGVRIVAKRYAKVVWRRYRWINWAMTSYYKLSINSHAAICSGLAAIFNAKLLPAFVKHLRQITVSYFSVDDSV